MNWLTAILGATTAAGLLAAAKLWLDRRAEAAAQAELDRVYAQAQARIADLRKRKAARAAELQAELDQIRAEHTRLNNAPITLDSLRDLAARTAQWED